MKEEFNVEVKFTMESKSFEEAEKEIEDLTSDLFVSGKMRSFATYIEKAKTTLQERTKDALQKNEE